LAVVALAAVTGCVHRVPEARAQWHPAEPALRQRADGLRATVQAVIDARVNLRRVDAAETQARGQGLAPRREWIDWFSLQDNLVIDLPSQSSRLIYLVAHVDKADANLLKVLSVMVNGALDEPIGFSFLGEGAIDNASGVAVVLDVARALRGAGLRHSVRVLLTGAEESGLRGARAHVAGLSAEEFSRIDAVINVDSVGAAGHSTCLVTNESDAGLAVLARKAAAEQGLELQEEDMIALAGGDHSAFASTSFFEDFGRGLFFNVTGGFLPQRSWLTRSKGTRVVAFWSCGLIDASFYVSSVLALPVGQLHGPRDNGSAIDVARLTEASLIVERLARLIDEAPN
jgi:hypothetical protein